MNFGESIELIKQGHKVGRKPWREKMQWLMYVKTAAIPYRGIGRIDTPAFIAQGVAGGDVVPYVPSQKDMLAYDWEDLG